MRQTSLPELGPDGRGDSESVWTQEFTPTKSEALHNNWTKPRGPLNGNYSVAERSYVYDMTMYMSDQTPPNAPATDLPTGWVKQVPSSFHVSATDGGIGLSAISVNAPNITSSTASYVGIACDQQRIAPYAPCPQTFSTGFPIDQQPADGIYTIPITASTPVKSTTINPQLKIDRTAPAADVSGDLWDVNGEEADLSAGSQSVNVSATDSDAGHATAGVTAIEFTVDGSDPDPAHDKKRASCDQGGCPLSAQFSYDPRPLVDGTHTLAVVVTDAAGNANTTSWNIVVNHSQVPSGCSSVESDSQEGPCADPDQASNYDPACGNIEGAGLASGPALLSSLEASSIASATPQLVAPSTTTTLDSQGTSPSMTAAGLIFKTAGTFTAGDVAPAPTNGLRVGRGPWSSCATPDANSTSSSGSLTGSAAVVFANTYPNVDTIVRPTPTGEMSIDYLKNAAAPTTYSWHITLPTGQKLIRLPDGNVAIVAPWVPAVGNPDGLTLGTVTNPVLTGSVASPDSGTVASVPDSASSLAAAQTEFYAAQQYADGYVMGIIRGVWARDAAGTALPVQISGDSSTVTLALPTLGPLTQFPVVLAASIDSADTDYDASYPSSDRQQLRGLETAPGAGTPQSSNPGYCYGPAQQYCKLKPEEKEFCFKYGWSLCYELNKDAGDASNLQDSLFTPKSTDQNVDATKANAFLHSYWTAAMTLTASRNGSHDASLGYKYAIAHEGHEYESKGRNPGWLSRMDIHNDYTGYSYANTRLSAHYQDMCSGMNDKVPNGMLVHHDPQNYVSDTGQLIWLYTRAGVSKQYGNGKMVHHRRVSCAFLYGPSSDIITNHYP